MTRRVLALLALTILTPLSVIPAQPPAAPRGTPQAAPRVQTTNGAVQGLPLASGVRAFRGLP